MKFIFSAFLMVFSLIFVPSTFPVFAQSVELSEEKSSIVYFTSEELKRNINELKYYDEVLTSSVLTYVFSGDEKWLNRYNNNELKLTEIIASLLAQQSIEDKDLVIILKKTNTII